MAPDLSSHLLYPALVSSVFNDLLRGLSLSDSFLHIFSTQVYTHLGFKLLLVHFRPWLHRQLNLIPNWVYVTIGNSNG